MTLPPPAPDSPDDVSEAALAQALAALDAEAGEAPAPDPVRVAAHLAGPGDEGLIREAAGSPRVRALLADVVDAERNATPEALPAALRERLLAAGPAARARSAPALRLLPARRIAAAAAVLLAGTTALLLLSSRVEAGPALPLEGLDRLDRFGAVRSQGPGSLPFGSRVEAATDERLSLRLRGGARVVLDGDESLRVARDRDVAALALDAGSAVVSAGPGPVLLLLPGGARVEVVEGAARVGAGPAGVAHDVALAEGARAVVTGTSGNAEPVAGPGAVRVASAVEPAGPVSESLFRDLEFFGGEPRSSSRDRVVSSRRFRILDAGVPGRARSSDAAGLPAIRLDLDSTWAAVAWRPDAEAASASRGEVLLRVRAPAEGAGGAARLRVTVSGEPARGETEGVVVPVSPGETTLRVPLSLDAGVGGADLVVSFRAENTPLRVWFEGVAFSGDARPAATIAVPEVTR